MGKKSQKSNDGVKSRIWNSLHDIELMLNSFEKYEIGTVLGKNDLQNFYNEKSHEVTNSKEKYVKKVNLSNLYFAFKAEQLSIIPHDVSMVYVLLSLKYEYSTPYLTNIDLFSDYQLDIEVKCNEGRSFAWHLDRETGTDGKYIHPLYHFHGGGKKVEGKDAGDLLILRSPRLAHPPMDLFLAIHFVLENFLNTKTYAQQVKIFEDPQYKEIIMRAQNRLLDPYYGAIVDKDKIEGNYAPHTLCPLYI